MIAPYSKVTFVVNGQQLNYTVNAYSPYFLHLTGSPNDLVFTLYGLDPYKFFRDAGMTVGDGCWPQVSSLGELQQQIDMVNEVIRTRLVPDNAALKMAQCRFGCQSGNVSRLCQAIEQAAKGTPC